MPVHTNTKVIQQPIDTVWSVLIDFSNAVRRSILPIGWWSLFSICVLYGCFAFYMAGIEIILLLGIFDETPARAAPPLFVLHAFLGGIAIICGPLQLNQRIRYKHRRIHRVTGWFYVIAVWIASVSAFWVAMFFDVNLAARFAFGMLAILWFATTTIALLSIIRRHVAQHREWMIRSFSLCFFVVTFSLWVPGLEGTDLPESIAYPMGVFLSWSLNLVAAQVWIYRTRRTLTVYPL